MQTAAIHQFHRVEQLAVLFAVRVQLHDVRVPEAFERFDLRLEANSQIGPVVQVAEQHFHRGSRASAFIHSSVDDAHAALAEHTFEPVRSKFFRGHTSIPEGNGLPKKSAEKIAAAPLSAGGASSSSLFVPGRLESTGS